MTPAAKVVARAALSEQIRQGIRERIIVGGFRPGDRLKISQLARDMGVSATPIREALAHLISEGLILLQSNRGYCIIPPPNASRFADLVDVLLLFETYAAKVGAPRGDPQVIEGLANFQQNIAALDKGSPSAFQSYLPLHQCFHSLLIDSADNRALSEQYKALSYHTHLALINHALPMNVRLFSLDHLPIVEAYSRKDGAAAERAVRTHILNSRDAIVRFLRDQRSSPDTEEVQLGSAMHVVAAADRQGEGGGNG